MKKMSLPDLLGRLCLFCLLLIGCVAAHACGQEDTWWKAPQDVSFSLNDRLPDAQLAEVSISMRPTAIGALQDLPFKRITRVAAEKYSNRAFVAGATHLNYYLVRAVWLIEGGRFIAYSRGSSVYVIHGDLGPDRPAVKSVVVVAVREKISEAFAACEIAE